MFDKKKGNSLEAFIVRLSFLVKSEENAILYECCPEERLAEIKSFEEIITLISYLNNNLIILPTILDTEKLRRLLRGYHYSNLSINVPIIDYFTFGNKGNLLSAFDLSVDNQKQYTLDNRFRYGFPISADEYGVSMKKLILSLNQNFENKVILHKI